MLTIFLFILSSILIVLLFINFSKLKNLEYRNMVLTKKINLFKNEVPKKQKSSSTIIRFIPTVYKNGVIAKDCKLLLTPMENSTVLKELKVRDSVDILDKCECNSIVWFYVKIFDSNDLNNRGWVISHNINTSLENLPRT